MTVLIKTKKPVAAKKCAAIHADDILMLRLHGCGGWDVHYFQPQEIDLARLTARRYASAGRSSALIVYRRSARKTTKVSGGVTPETLETFCATN